MGLKIAGNNWSEIEEKRKSEIINEIAKQVNSKHPELLEKKLVGEELKHAEEIITHITSKHPKVAPGEVKEIVDIIIGQATGYGKLDRFFNGPGATEITEISVVPTENGPEVFYCKNGHNHHYKEKIFKDNAEVLRYAVKICQRANRSFDERNQIVDAWLPDGSRVSVMGFKAVPLGVSINIRKSPLLRPPLPLEKMIESRTFPKFVADLMVDLIVVGHANLGIFGRTDSGKTTLLRALGLHIDPSEKVIIGETSYELFFPHLLNCINLVEHVVGGKVYVSMTDICKAINRNNPDRALVGEIRGGEVVAASEIAESTSGGFWTSGHAGSVNQLRQRLPKMFRNGGVDLPLNLVDEQIRSMFHFLIFVDKDSSGKRALMDIVEVTESGYRTIITFDREEFARDGKTRRWIYKNPVSPERLGMLAFRGARIKDEYKQVHQEYLYIEEMVN